MPRLTTWKPNKTDDYYFFDRTISEQFRIGGVGVYVHKYIGPDVGGNDGSDPTQPANDLFSGAVIEDSINELTIQDVLFMENRDRKYDKDVFELRGVYNVGDNDFDLSQFGLFLSGDTVFMTFHINDMIEIMGRRLINGDVLEMPHLLDDTALNAAKGPLPKFYVVQDGQRGAEGFSQTWLPHIWRVKLTPMNDAREYSDILGHAEEEHSLKNAVSTYQTDMDIANAVVEAATNEDPDTCPLTEHLFGIDQESHTYDHGEQINSGTSFPGSPNEGDFFVRTDFNPKRLFARRGTKWHRLLDNVRPETWTEKTYNAATFFENSEETMVRKDGQEINERTNISKAVLPRADFGGRSSEERDSNGRITKVDPLDGNIPTRDRRPIPGAPGAPTVPGGDDDGEEGNGYVDPGYVDPNYTE